jgi:hypothetical protein
MTHTLSTIVSCCPAVFAGKPEALVFKAVGRFTWRCSLGASREECLPADVQRPFVTNATSAAHTGSILPTDDRLYTIVEPSSTRQKSEFSRVI